MEDFQNYWSYASYKICGNRAFETCSVNLAVLEAKMTA